VLDRRVEILEQPDPGVPARRRAGIARELDEVEVMVNRDRARQVGDEEEARLQRADEERLAPPVVVRDLAAELVDASSDLARGEVDVADALVVVGQEASSRRNRWARRSTSRL
jgi:hypothetical protein